MATITLLTGNQRKKDSLSRIFESMRLKGVGLVIENPWLPEIQADTTAEIAAFAARYGADMLNKPVIKMDSGFFVEALGGFPGPFVRTTAEKIGQVRFFTLLDDIENKRAWLTNSLSYCEPGSNPVTFNAQCEGEVVATYVPINLSFIDELFIPHHPINLENKTMGQLRLDDPTCILDIWGDAEYQFSQWYQNR